MIKDLTIGFIVMSGFCVVYSCAESQHLDTQADNDYTLIVKAEDMGGSPNALSSTTRVNVIVRQNLWVNPGPIVIRENLKGAYPMEIATVSHISQSQLLCHSVGQFN